MHLQNDSIGNCPIQFLAVLQPFWPRYILIKGPDNGFLMMKVHINRQIGWIRTFVWLPKYYANAAAILSDLHTTSQVNWLCGEHARTSDTQCPVIIHQIREGNKHESILIIGLDGVLFRQDKLASSVRDSGASLPSKFASVTGMASPAAVAVAELLVTAGNSALFLLNSWTTCKNQIHLEYMNFHWIMS